MAPVPLPAGFGLRFSSEVRRPRPEVLIGGTPVKVLRLTAAGASLVDTWMAGRPVGRGRAAGVLAARLVESGLAAPVPPAPPPRLRVAAVIPVRDDPDGVAVTLDALAATAPELAVTVVDDGSVPPVAVPQGVTLVRRATPGGPGAARNTGLRRMPEATDVVVFVDAACVVPPGWLQVLLAHFADPGLAAVAPRVSSRPAPGSPAGLARYEAARSPLDLGPEGGPVRPGAAVPYVPTALLAVRTAALAEVGSFDESVRFGEDVDLVWRLGQAGWRVRYEPAARATHPARAGWAGWARQRFDYGRSATPLGVRHGRAVAPLTVSPWSVAAWCFLAAGRPGPALAMATGTAQMLARRAGPDPAVARELRRLALLGSLRAGGPIASAIRRAWLPPAGLAGALAWSASGPRRRAALLATAGAVLAGPGLADWWSTRPAGAGPLSWVAWRLADDLAYQAGVWAGAVRARSPAALLPRW